MTARRDHGGGVDAARARWGGDAGDWLDLSTGINPTPYPIPDIPHQSWTRLPDHDARQALIDAARRFWDVPDHLDILAAPGASALIAQMPNVLRGMCVDIPEPTYNEHAASFRHQGWDFETSTPDVRVLVHPNNPDGRVWTADDLTAQTHVIDESFCDVMPGASLIRSIGKSDVILKSFGKFWGLAGMRLGFAIADPAVTDALREAIGPWPVAGPALDIGTAALSDHAWAEATRGALRQGADRLDDVMARAGADLCGGTSLFRLYQVDNAAQWQDKFARNHVWTRCFDYAPNWLRLGLPPADRWSQVERAAWS